MRALASLVMLICATAMLCAEDGPQPAAAAPTAPAAKAVKAPSALSFLADEEKWVFAPTVGRPDIFYDYEGYLRALKDIKSSEVGDAAVTKGPAIEDTDPIEQAKADVQRIEGLVATRKYEDAMKVADSSIKKLEKHTDIKEIPSYIATIKGYRDQAEDALTRDEAQAAFDALSLKVVGILWSESGTRLALIAGEPRALGVNERVKDCVIINIDTDRVDFRYHYKRKRFEFPRYVGEDAKSK